MEDWWTLGIIGRKLSLEQEDSILVRSPGGTNDHEAKQIHAVLVGSAIEKEKRRGQKNERGTLGDRKG